MTSQDATGSSRARCALAVAMLCYAAARALGQESAAAASDPLRAAPFSASAAQLLAAASSATPGEAEALILIDEHSCSFDAQGRRSAIDRMVYRILDESAIEEWSSLETEWAPWNEEKPILRARVVTPDGKEHSLDPKTIAEEGTNEASRLLYGNRRRLRAPLPSVTVGCVVETEITTREKEPLFDAGRVSTFSFDHSVPVQFARVTIEVPRDFELATVVHVTPELKAHREELPDRLRLTWETAARREPFTDWEPSAPSDSPQASYIAAATGRSWSRVAKRYAEIVEEQIRGADLRAAVAEAAGGAADRSAVFARLLAWIQKRVRYTGVEFNEATIVPRPPVETLRRGYGDCKDKAALLVAALRELHIPAFVALLKTGPGIDVNKTLYGMGWFDHAIVYVPGPPAVWIDPTESLARAGELPNASQDRLALVASGETTDLIRTPAAAPADNTKREVREFSLAELGNAKVVETTEVTGTKEISYRHSYADSNHKQAQETIEEYTRSEYLRKGAAKYSHSDPTNLSRPFTLKIEAEDAGRGVSLADQAVVAVLPSTIVESFPYAFRTSPDDESEQAARSSAHRPKRRTLDYVFAEPFVEEWTYRIHPPVGYRGAALPESKEGLLGVAAYSKRFWVEPDGTVMAKFHIDVRKRRLSPEEFEATREAVSKLAKEQAIFIRLEQVGQSHLAAGRIKEALGEFRRLAALHPKEALHPSQVSMALLQGGLGEAAREEARRATVLEPKSAVAWRTLGWVLQHDTLGRRFRTGFSRDEAVAAYRKSRELDASDFITRADLAILLEHNAEGTRYGHGADLDGAIGEYRAIRQDLKNHSFDLNLCLALMRAVRFTDLAEAARELPASPTRDQLLVLAAVAKGGSQAGLSEASQLVSETSKRRETIETVGRTLIQLRRYPDAAAFLAAAVSGSPNSATLRAQADMIAKAKRHEDVHLDENDPKSLFPKLISVFFSKDRPDPSELAPLMASSLSKENMDSAKTSLATFRNLKRSLLPQVEGPLDFIVDLALPAIRQEVEGDDEAGYRIHVMGAAGVGVSNETFFVVREDGHPRFLADVREIDFLGRQALNDVEAGRLAAARRLLDWAREDLPAGSSDDPIGGPVFSQFWTKGKDPGADRTRLAAAMLGIGIPNAQREIAVLLASQSSLRSDVERAVCDRALSGAYIGAKEYEKALPLVDRLVQAYPDSATAFRQRSIVLMSLKRRADARTAALERLARLADDPDALRVLFQASSLDGDYAAAEKWGRRLTSLSSAIAEDYNSLAWNSLFIDGPNERAIDDGRRAVDLTRQNNAASLHTLATLYAEVGKTTEAHELILKSIDAAGRDLPQDHDWYVFGRIAENYGETAAAAAAYRRVEKPANDLDLAESTFLLASRRLKALGAQEPASPRGKTPSKKRASEPKG